MPSPTLAHEALAAALSALPEHDPTAILRRQLRAAGEAAGLDLSQFPQNGVRFWRISDVRNETLPVPDPEDPGEDSEPDDAEDSEQDPPAGTRSTADVYVFGDIGGFCGVDSTSFVNEVASLDVDHIDLHLNTRGGSVFEGVAMANVLRNHRADITVWVDGLAASAGSVIAMAGDEVVMNLGAQMMIHDASASAGGNPAELSRTVRALESISNSLASIYAARAGGVTADWRAAMVEETWYTAEEAVAAGLADRLATAKDRGRATGQHVNPGGGGLGGWWDRAGAIDRHDLAVFNHAGRQDAPPPAMPSRKHIKPSAQQPSAHEGEPVSDFPDEGMAQLRTALGLPEDADPSAIVAAAQHRSAAALPEGVVTIDKTMLDDLKASAARGDEARAQQEREGIERQVTDAIAAGKIPPAAKQGWIKALSNDPGGHQATHLANMESGLIPLSERGYENDGRGDREPTLADVDNDPAYAGWSI